MSKLTSRKLAEIERRALSDPLMADALAEIQRLKRAILFAEPDAEPLAPPEPTQSAPSATSNGHGVEITGRLHQATALNGRRTARYITLSLVTNQKADEFIEQTRGKLSQQVTVKVS